MSDQEWTRFYDRTWKACSDKHENVGYPPCRECWREAIAAVERETIERCAKAASALYDEVKFGPEGEYAFGVIDAVKAVRALSRGTGGGRNG